MECITLTWHFQKVEKITIKQQRIKALFKKQHKLRPSFISYKKKERIELEVPTKNTTMLYSVNYFVYRLIFEMRRVRTKNNTSTKNSWEQGQCLFLRKKTL